MSPAEANRVLRQAIADHLDTTDTKRDRISLEWALRLTASPVQGAASASRETCTQDGGKCGIGGYCFGCHQFPIATSASGEAKGAAVKPWQERCGITRKPEGQVESAMAAEIADWRALAERAQAAPTPEQEAK